MITFDVSAAISAQNHSPQIERFIVGNVIYVVEYNSDYDSLPSIANSWRNLMACNG